MMEENHAKVINLAKKFPTYFVRYEDLRTEPIPVLLEVFKFLLDTPNIEGTVVEKRIFENCGAASKELYKLKSKSNNLNRNIDMYSQE